MVWNNTDVPIAFLITFRCRATWLHGDIRGSVGRAHNRYGTPILDHDPARKDYAINVRTNHAHSVISEGGTKPEKMLTAFKANSTRMMKESGLWTFEYSPWAEKGSRRWLWTERHLANAIEYVVNGQGDVLPEFD